MSAADLFFTDTNVSGEYEKIMTKLKNAKRSSTTKTNALETYLNKWNKKSDDEILPLQKSMIFGKVTADIDAVRKIMVSMEAYYDLILTTAEQIDEKHGLGVGPLREQYEKLEQEVEKRRSEAMENIELKIEGLLKDARRYSAEVKPGIQAGGVGGQVEAPTTTSAPFRFRPLEELSPGEISQDISPQEFEDWILGFEDYMMTGTSDGDNIPDKFRVSYFMSKLDSWWKDRLRSEVDRTRSWEMVVGKMHKVLLSTNPLFLRRVNTFALKQ